MFPFVDYGQIFNRNEGYLHIQNRPQLLSTDLFSKHTGGFLVICIIDHYKSYFLFITRVENEANNL